MEYETITFKGLSKTLFVIPFENVIDHLKTDITCDRDGDQTRVRLNPDSTP